MSVSSSSSQADFKTIRESISNWLKSRLSEKAFSKLTETGETLKKNPEDWELFTSFSAVPRHTGKDAAGLTKKELEEAGRLRPGWDPSQWSLDQLGRTFLLLNFAEQGESVFQEKIEKIFISSDMGEAVALYQSLSVFPWPERFTERAAEGVRSNITTVFNAVALRNPYPAEYMDEGAWNQIVLKALFVESPLYLIQGLDKRANAGLAKMLVEYAHERWSAGRPVSPELWRPVGPFVDKNNIDDLQKVIEHPDNIRREAAVLALSASSFSGAEKLLENHQDLVDSVRKKSVTWDEIGKRFEKEE